MVHMIMEAEISQELQLASWRSRKANHVVPAWVWKTENQERQWCKSSLRTREDRCLSSDCQAEELPTYLFFLFYSGLSWLDEAHLHFGEQSVLFTLWIQMLLSSKNLLTGMFRLMFEQIFEHYMVQSHQYIK